MSGYPTIVTRKGQITLPAEIRRALGIQQGDRITVELINGEATFKKVGGIIARTAGAVAPVTPLSAEALREAGEQAWTSEAVERNHGV